MFLMISEHSFRPRRKEPAMKEEYIQKIVELLERCNDIPLLDLILKLLQKS